MHLPSRRPGFRGAGRPGSRPPRSCAAPPPSAGRCVTRFRALQMLANLPCLLSKGTQTASPLPIAPADQGSSLALCKRTIANPSMGGSRELSVVSDPGVWRRGKVRGQIIVSSGLLPSHTIIQQAHTKHWWSGGPTAWKDPRQSVCAPGSETRRPGFKSLLPTYQLCALGQFLNLSVPQFPHL